MFEAFTLRPVREDDISALTGLVGNIAGGLTTLPHHPRFLEERIHASQRAFYPKVERPGAEHYLFVLEQVSTGQLIGTCGIVAQVGGFEPFYTYQIRREAHVYEPLQVDREMRVLHLQRNHKGPSEICSLYLHPDYRRAGLGKLLSLARFLFMGRFPRRFAPEVIAELRGYLDPAGDSPFWEAVGKVFFRRDYYTADVLSGLGQKDFIEALMPRHPIYVALLPKAARDVIGAVHRDTEAAFRLLQREGFEMTDEIDIFDAGPLVRATLENLRTVKAMRTAPLAIDPLGDGGERPNAIATNRALDFRATLCRARRTADGALQLPAPTRAALGLSAGDPVDYLPLDA